MVGWCADKFGRDQIDGQIKIGYRASASSCLTACEDKKEATGCEYYTPRGDCYFHTQDITAGSGHHHTKCFVFGEKSGLTKVMSITILTLSERCKNR